MSVLCKHKANPAKARREPAFFAVLHTLGMYARELWVLYGLKSHPACSCYDCSAAAKEISSICRVARFLLTIAAWAYWQHFIGPVVAPSDIVAFSLVVDVLCFFA